MIAVILCGGAGSRLWPLSREEYPKPFIRLADGRSFIKKTYLRAAAVPETEGILVVTNRRIRFKVAEECLSPEAAPKPSFILEPFARNTAPAITAAALVAGSRYGPEAPLAILPSDHLVADQDGFNAMIARGLELAAAGRLVAFGIAPVRPETGFGYIEAEGERVIRFVEKPSRDKAEEYLASGRFLWNSGIFCFQAGAFLAEMGRRAPGLLRAVEACLAASRLDGAGGLLLDPDSFAKVPGISIDYALFEKSEQMAVVRGDGMGWSDIGSWPELCGLRPADSEGNHVSRPDQAVLHEVRNSDIDNHVRLVAALGVENLLVVDTEDALLVADKSRSQEVRLIYDRLKESNHETHRRHPTVFTPWGYYSLLEEGDRFKTKRLVLKPGAKISLQAHHHRSEHWVVVNGMAEVTRGEQVFFVNSNESTYIKAGVRHRVANPGKIELVLIEVQSGDYLGEDDIVRFDDLYGRDCSAPGSGG
ncbi:MAG: mannose-1-phosphate guanylyltransferase/mannose-6-phosphate isomerase [Planctomycetota bacterium]|nr:mannose-1-phosphate guanylyltransferase/mannose-6-phosphate isomerase [Planctomycetota bacterium]